MHESRILISQAHSRTTRLGILAQPGVYQRTVGAKDGAGCLGGKRQRSNMVFNEQYLFFLNTPEALAGSRFFGAQTYDEAPHPLV